MSKNIYTYANPPSFDEPAGSSGRGFMYVLIFIVCAAFGGFVWNFYSGTREIPHIAAPPGAYRVAPTDTTISAQDDATDTTYIPPEQTDGATAAADAAPPPAAPVIAPPTPSTPNFTGNGPYVAQIAALQSEDAVQPAWRRFASRAPQLFGSAHLDVERADLGQRGVYFRLRAGYFADRDNAARFCERIRAMGQDCIVVAR